MEVLSGTLHILLEFVVALLTQPFYYIFLLAVLLHYRRQGLLERRLFHIRVHFYAGRVLRTVVAGLIVGVLASLLMTGIGIHTQPMLLWLISGLIVILSLFRLRLAHLLDALALLSVIYVILWFVPDVQPAGWLGELVSALRSADWFGLFALAVLLQLAEAVLFRLQAPGLSSPVNIEGKRGKPVGGYTLDAFWPVPVWLLVPAVSGWILPWQPLHAGEVGSAGVALSVLPIMIGTSVLTQSELPRTKAQLVSKQLWQISAVLIILAVAAYWWPPLALLGIWIGVIGREYIVYASRRKEVEQMPMYTHSLRGLRILDVIPGSPADELGIKSAETVFKANGVQVHSSQSLHEALRLSPAFCKLEILNRDGESKFLQRAIYAGEHHQLGMIFVPQDEAAVTREVQRLNAFHLLRKPVVSKGDTHAIRSRSVVSLQESVGSGASSTPELERLEKQSQQASLSGDTASSGTPSRANRASRKESEPAPLLKVEDTIPSDSPKREELKQDVDQFPSEPVPAEPPQSVSAEPTPSVESEITEADIILPRRSRKTDHR